MTVHGGIMVISPNTETGLRSGTTLEDGLPRVLQDRGPPVLEAIALMSDGKRRRA